MCKKNVLLEYSSLLFGSVNGPDENSTVISNAQFLRIWHNVWDLQPTLVTTKLYTVKKNNIHFCFPNLDCYSHDLDSRKSSPIPPIRNP